MSDLPKDQIDSEDLFDFPEVEGFSPEFLEAARLQTEAANTESPETDSSFDDEAEPLETTTDTDFDDEDFEDDFADDFADLMGDPDGEAPEEEEPVDAATATPVATPAAAATGFDFRFVWGALTLLFIANLLWAWTWHTSEDRLRGEMDQRFQGYLAQQRNQLGEAVSALAPSGRVEQTASGRRPLLGNVAPVDDTTPLLEEIKRDLMHSRYETARAKAWRLIARVDALPTERRDSVEASAHLLIAESYEIQGTDSRENEG